MPDFESLEPYAPRGGGIIFAPNPYDSVANQEFEGVFRQSGIAEWTEERRKLGEHIDPRLLYVIDASHVVAWISHTGFISDGDKPMRGYSVHHVVCDCAAEVTPEAHPSIVQDCEYVQTVLDQRAYEVGKEQGIDDLLDSLSYFDETELNINLSYLGRELVARTIANILEIDRKRPEKWMANKINGLHHVDILAAIVRQGTDTVMPILEELEEAGVVALSGDTVKLKPTIL